MLCVLFLGSVRVAGCMASRPHIFGKSELRKLPRLPGGALVETDNKGRSARGYFIRNGNRLVVIFHGRGTTIYHEAYPARKLARNGFSVLLFEYPGYGISSNFSPSESNYYSDAQALISMVQEKYSFAPRNTIAWGYSLGTGTAVEMLQRKLVGKAILLAPYTSIPALAARRTIPILPHLLIHDRFASRAKAPDIRTPVLIIHGIKDSTIPFAMGRELHERFPNSTLIRIPDGTHRLFAGMRNRHWRTIYRFIKSPGCEKNTGCDTSNGRLESPGFARLSPGNATLFAIAMFVSLMEDYAVFRFFRWVRSRAE